jgi:hypothetical protein
MPSKYDFETEADRQADHATLQCIGDALDATVTDVVQDYLDAIPTPDRYVVVRAPQPLRWSVENHQTDGRNAPLSITLVYRPVGEKVPQLTMEISSRLAVNTRNTLRLMQVLADSTNCPVITVVIEVEDEASGRILRQANLWP